MEIEPFGTRGLSFGNKLEMIFTGTEMNYRSIFSPCGAILALMTAVAPAEATTGTSTIVRFDTTFGTFDVRLYDEAMPNSVENFLNYVEDGAYTESFIHRSVSEFVVQGGGFRWQTDGNLSTIPTDDPIDDEPGGGVAGISNQRGTIAFAKSGPNTVTSQWFFNLGDNSNLDNPARPDGGFAAFGRVLGNGMEVVDQIASQQIVDFSGSISPFGNLPLLDSFGPGGGFFREDLVFINSVVERNFPAGDYNFDGVVDAADFTVWRDSLGSTTLAEADGNGNGVVDQADYQVWLDTFGETSVSGALLAATVPEPTGAAILAGLLALAAGLRSITQRE